MFNRSGFFTVDGFFDGGRRTVYGGRGVGTRLM